MADDDQLVRARVLDTATVIRGGDDGEQYDGGEVIPKLPLAEVEWLNADHDRVTVVEYLSNEVSGSATPTPNEAAIETTETAVESDRDTDVESTAAPAPESLDEDTSGDPETDIEAVPDDATDFEPLEDIGETYAGRLHDAGFATVGDLRAASADDLAGAVPERVAESVKSQVGDSESTPPDGDEDADEEAETENGDVGE